MASRPARAFQWWWALPALAAAAGLVAVLVGLPGRPQDSTRANQLLAESARVEFPERRPISLRMGGRTLIRPAVLRFEDAAGTDPEPARLRKLFAAANYSWRDPLSARSYQAWRSGLRSKRDTVSVIGGQGAERGYRVRTDTAVGVLRSASLTIRAKDLRPTNGAFQFEGEGLLEMDEAEFPASAAPRHQSVVPGTRAPETPAGPVDTLHVLAALDEIGADVDEPLEVSIDPQRRHVLIRGSGIDPRRQQQIAEAVKRLPRVELDFVSGTPGPFTGRPSAPEKSSSNIPAALRQRFEAALGGAIALQEVTDRVLEASGSMLARAHAVELLASTFPPETEELLPSEDSQLLQALRWRHLSELGRLAAQIRAALKPLLAASPNSPAVQAVPWQAGVPALVEAAQRTDRLLNRLLAGSYSQASGEEMLRELGVQIERVETVLQSQPEPGR